MKGKHHLVCRLKQSLYVLKHSPSMWYEKFDAFGLNLGCVISEEDHHVYIKDIDDQVLNIILYVDGILFMGNI